jgi:polyhydroxybutyrate depolymerase
MRTLTGISWLVAVAAVALAAGCSGTGTISGHDAATGAAGGSAGIGGGGSSGTGSAGTGGMAGGAAGASGGAPAGGSGGGPATVGSGGGLNASDGLATDGGPEAGSADGGDASSSPSDRGLAAPMPSDGCGKAPTQALAAYTRKTVTGSTRVYDLWVPAGYDPKRVYPTIFVAHGCDGSIPYHMETVTKGDAILVALRSKDSQNSGMPYGGGCFDTMPANSPEIPYFDQVLKDVSSNLCVDKARVFITGHSSGSWLSYLIGCARGGVVRGEGNTAGGLSPGIPTCSGPLAAMMMHDTQDTLNLFTDGEKARDRILKMNECGTTTIPYDYDGDPKTPSPCLMYQGCKAGFPVVWCPTTGKGHSDQIPISTVGLWRFWSQF